MNVFAFKFVLTQAHNGRGLGGGEGKYGHAKIKSGFRVNLM